VAVTVDNTIARVNNLGGTTATSGSFDVASGDLLVVCANSDEDLGACNFAISDNQTPDLGWTLIADRTDVDGNEGGVAAYFYHSASSISGLTVTITVSGDATTDSPSIKVYKCTGHDSADPLGASGEGNLSTDPQTTTAITSETAGAFFCLWTDWNQTGTPTSSDLTISTFDMALNISGASGYKSIASAGASVTGDINSPATPLGNYIVFEIRAAGAASNPAQAKFMPLLGVG